MFGVDVGGNILAANTLSGVSTAAILNLRLVVRRRGRTVNAAILDPAAAVHAQPAFPFTVQESGDGHDLYVVPDGLWQLVPDTACGLRRDTDNGTNTVHFDRTARWPATSRRRSR